MKKITVIFQSTRDAISADKYTETSDIEYRIIPVPRSISSECGVAFEIPETEHQKLIALFQEKNIHAQFITLD